MVIIFIRASFRYLEVLLLFYLRASFGSSIIPLTYLSPCLPPAHQRRERQAGRGIALPAGIPGDDQFLFGTVIPM